MASFVTLQFIDVELDSSTGCVTSDFGGCEVGGSKMVSGFLSPRAVEKNFDGHIALDDELHPDIWSVTTHDVPISDTGTGIRVVQVIVWFGGQIAPQSKQLKSPFWIFARGGRVVLGRKATRNEAIAFAGLQVQISSGEPEGEASAQEQNPERTENDAPKVKRSSPGRSSSR